MFEKFGVDARFTPAAAVFSGAPTREQEVILKRGPDNRPNFFIVGAQKCGTTSLSQHLGTHPDIAVSIPKEPYYFATDFAQLRRAGNMEQYLEFFRHAPADAKAIGEASAGYLFSSVAIRNIRDFDANAKIIVMMRHPVDLVHSLHSQLLFSFNEDESDFSRAWELQDDRLRGRHLPKRCLAPQFLQYREVGMLGKQIERLLGVFPREQVLFIFFEDFVSRTGAIYREVLRFLDVANDQRTSFRRANSQKRHRFPWLFAPLSRRPAWVQTGIDQTKALLGPVGVAWLQRVYASPRARVPLPDPLRREMEAVFLSDIEVLSQITGRDLRHWTRHRQAAAAATS